MTNIGRTALTLGVALALGACGGGGDTTGDTGDGATGASSVSMVDNAFEPSSLSVSSGGEVELTNDGESPHTFTVEGNTIDEEVEPGASSSVTIDLDPGTYDVICRFHEAQGMTGTLTVE
jgi:plastocyanin